MLQRNTTYTKQNVLFRLRIKTWWGIGLTTLTVCKRKKRINNRRNETKISKFKSVFNVSSSSGKSHQHGWNNQSSNHFAITHLFGAFACDSRGLLFTCCLFLRCYYKKLQDRQQSLINNEENSNFNDGVTFELIKNISYLCQCRCRWDYYFYLF